MEKKYSVLMSLYKKENPEFLKLALDSMINQTIKPDEIVLVEDGPLTDELHNVVNEYKNKYKNLFNIVVNKKNMGLGLALNAGLKECKNELVARMDTDDISKPDRCEKQLEYFEKHEGIDIIGGQIEEFIEKNVFVGKRIVPCKHPEIINFLKKRCPFNHMTVMFKKNSVMESGSYKDFLYNEDYDLWIRMFLNNKHFANLNSILVDVRVGKNMYARRGGVNYFKSEVKIQKILFNKNIISFGRFFINITERLIVQLVLTNSVRGFIFKTIARKR